MRAAFCLSLMLMVFSGCGEKPQQAYERLVFNAKMGNEAAFLEGFTEKSGRLVRTLLALRRTYGDDVSPNADPYKSLVLEQVESVEVKEDNVKVWNEDGKSEEVKKKIAILTVTDGKIYRKIKMVQLDDGWKIDALDLQEFWAKERENFLTR